MIIELTKGDNDIIINHLYKYNEGAEVTMKMAMDVYIKTIEFTEKDIIFHFKGIKPILDDDCNITDKNIGKGIDIDREDSVPLSKFEPPYNNILYGAIREIKLNKLL